MAKKKNKQRNNPSNSHRSNDEMRISVSMRKKYGDMAETDKYSRGSSEYRSLLKKMTEEVYAMPHSFYGKIMEIVRQRKIPVKYFAYASADKCAKQLAEDDIKLGE